jgi:hypothetical protein
MIPSVDALNDFCARAILRAIRRKHGAGLGIFGSPILDINQEIDSLRLYWALSESIHNLVRFLLDHSRSPLTRIDFEEAEAYGNIPGALLAGRSSIEQMRRGDPCLFLVEEPSATVLWPANRLVAWTLNEAFQVLLSTQKRFDLGEEYEWLHPRAQELDNALRNKAISEILLTPQSRRRPSVDAQRSCARSRSQLYRLALEAFSLLASLEAGEDEAVLTILRTSILPNLEPWRRFELATALSATEALAIATGQVPHLTIPIRGGTVVATVGEFDIYWQYAMPKRDLSFLDKTEKLANDLMASLGISGGTDISDLTIVWRPGNTVIGIVECKWFESQGATYNAIRDASSQMARYIRDIYPDDDALAVRLASNSIIVTAELGPAPESIDGSKAIHLTDFVGLKVGKLNQWAVNVVASVPAQPEQIVA